jgi:hypothetical protein
LAEIGREWHRERGEEWSGWRASGAARDEERVEKLS